MDRFQGVGFRRRPARAVKGRTTRRPGPFVALAVLLAVALTVSGGPAGAQAVGLGTAESFAVLAGTTVTNTGPSVISGSVGVSPGTAVVGFPPGVVTNGTIHAANAAAAQAQADLTTAYLDAAGRTPCTPVTGDLGGQVLGPGVYCATTLAITGTLTLDAQGDPDAAFIFQAGSTLITAPDSAVVLVNGAQACNVFWQVGSSATLGVGSTFRGTILALTAITANTNAVIEGRLLARNAAVTLDSNTITRPVCAPPTTTTTTPGATTTTVPGATTTTTPGATTTTTPGTTTTTTPGATTTTTPGATTTTTPAGGTTTTAPGATTTTAPGGAGATTTVPAAANRSPSGTTSTIAGFRVAGISRTGADLDGLVMAAVLGIILGGVLLLAARDRPPVWTKPRRW